MKCTVFVEPELMRDSTSTSVKQARETKEFKEGSQ